MKATVWNDFLQMVVIIAGLFCIIIIGTLRLGGIKRVWEINEEGGRIILNEYVTLPDSSQITTKE